MWLEAGERWCGVGSLRMVISLEDWYPPLQIATPNQLLTRLRFFQIPLITRIYLTLALGTTLLCALEMVSPFSLYFNWNAIVYKFEVSTPCSRATHWTLTPNLAPLH